MQISKTIRSLKIVLKLSKTMWNFDKAQILPSHFSGHLQGIFFFRKLSLEYAFGSSNTKLKLLIVLVIN